MKGVLSLVVSSMILLAEVGPAHALHIVTFPFSAGPTVTDGSFVTPTDPLNPVRFAAAAFNGTNVIGDFSFTAAGSTATISYSVQGSLPYNPPLRLYQTTSTIDAYLATNANLLVNQPHLDSFTVTTQLVGVAGSSVTASGAPLSLPYNVGPAETGIGTHEFVSVQSAPFTASGPFTIEQDATLTFSNLQAGDIVWIHLPNGSSVDPAVTPEPATFTLFAIALGGLAGYRWRNRRKQK